MTIGGDGVMIRMNHSINGVLMKSRGRVLAHNNFLFGMAAGRNLAFSPVDLMTATTRDGVIDGAAARPDGQVQR